MSWAGATSTVVALGGNPPPACPFSLQDPAEFKRRSPGFTGFSFLTAVIILLYWPIKFLYPRCYPHGRAFAFDPVRAASLKNFTTKGITLQEIIDPCLYLGFQCLTAVYMVSFLDVKIERKLCKLTVVLSPPNMDRVQAPLATLWRQHPGDNITTQRTA